MNAAYYIVQVNIYLILFYLFYQFLLNRETFFNMNRLYLVLSGVFSLLIPVMQMQWVKDMFITKKIQSTQVILGDVMSMVEVTPMALAENDYTLGDAIAGIYLIGVCLSAMVFFYRLLLLFRKFKQKNSGAAFSFFNKKQVDESLPNADVILFHEKIHAMQLHSFDVLFFEVLRIAFWFNPIILLYQRAVKNIHEFIADEKTACYQGDKAAYAMLIVSNTLGISPHQLANQFFNQSLLKTRIFMLHKEKSRRTAVLKYGIVLPLFAGMLIFSSAKIDHNNAVKAVTEEIVLSKPIGAVKEALALPIEIVTSKGPGIKEERSTKVSLLNVTKELSSIVATGYSFAKPVAMEKVYDFVSIDKAPDFPGGIAAFYKYFAENARYPEQARNNKVQGKVFLSFIVEPDGSISNTRVDRGLGSGLDEEAARVISESPEWNPGIKDGQAVRVKFNIGVNFSLDSKIESKNGRNDEWKGNKMLLSGFAGDSPIFLVDGVVADVSDGSVDDLRSVEEKIGLRAEDVESINVLKGAAVSSIYGAKGANGVVLITTKRGHKIKGGAQASEESDRNEAIMIEKNPDFPGGIHKFYEYVGKTVRYPAEARKNNIAGKVFLSFTVDKDGSLKGVKVDRGLGFGLDEEAIRVLEESPRWNPGIQNGKPVSVKYNIGLNFTLQK